MMSSILYSLIPAGPIGFLVGLIIRGQGEVPRLSWTHLKVDNTQGGVRWEK